MVIPEISHKKRMVFEKIVSAGFRFSNKFNQTVLNKLSCDIFDEKRLIFIDFNQNSGLKVGSKSQAIVLCV